MTMRKKLIIAIVILSLVLSVEVVSTLAWLSDKTDPVINTFTYGDINIDLTETKTDFKMVPGNTIEKDPKVTVEAGSEDCYLFVKIEESDNLVNYITYVVADGWTALDGVAGVYYRKAKAGESFDVIGNKGFDGQGNFTANKVLVKTTITKQMMENIKTSGMPTLSFTAYAVQQANVADAAAAWAIANPSTP